MSGYFLIKNYGEEVESYLVTFVKTAFDANIKKPWF